LGDRDQDNHDLRPIWEKSSQDPTSTNDWVESDVCQPS
jgi:hypothetical protein